MSNPREYDVFYIGIFRTDPKPATELAAARNLSKFNYFTRGMYENAMHGVSRGIAESVKSGTREVYEEEPQPYHFHCYADPKLPLCAFMITDLKYPMEAAQNILFNIVGEFNEKHPKSSYTGLNARVSSCPMPALEKYVIDYRNPAEGDVLTGLKNNIDDTKKVLQKTVAEVARRGESITELLAKSENLSRESNSFMHTAKKQNSCCIVM